MTIEFPMGFELRPMTKRDVKSALQVIRQHDPEDFASAKESYAETLEGQFVLTADRRVIGCTGFYYADGTDSTFFLGWTYLLDQHQGTGLGKLMLEQVIEELYEYDARKIFVETSDYIDPRHGEIYRQALEAYRGVGFQEELRHAHYYEPDESQIVLGMRLKAAEAPDPPPPEHREIVITEVEEIPDAEGAYYLDWEFVEGEGHTTESIEEVIEEVRSHRARVLFMGVPSHVVHISQMFTSTGFREDGRLLDFYEDGIDDIRYRYDL